MVPGSDVAIIQMAGGVSMLLDEPTFDLDRARGELGKMRGGYGAATVPEAFQVARAVQPRLNHLNREVIVLTDFQKVTWSDPAGLPAVKRARTHRTAGSSAPPDSKRGTGPAPPGPPAPERPRLAGQLAEGKTPPRV